MPKRSRPRLQDSQLFSTLLESRPGVPKPIDDSLDVDDLPGVNTAPVRHSDVLASVDARAPRSNVLDLASLLDSRTDQAAPMRTISAQRAKLERVAREARETRRFSRARRGRR